MNFPNIIEMSLQGLTPAQIADSLQLDEKEVEAAIASDLEREKTDTIDDLYEREQVNAVKTLASIMKSSENDSARVSAAKVLLTRGGNVSEDTLLRLKDRFERMKIVVNKSERTSNVVSFTGTMSGEGNGNQVSLNLVE